MAVSTKRQRTNWVSGKLEIFMMFGPVVSRAVVFNVIF